MRLIIASLLLLCSAGTLSCSGPTGDDPTPGERPYNGLQIAVLLDEATALSNLDALSLQIDSVVLDATGPNGPVSVQNSQGAWVELVGGLGGGGVLALELATGKYQDVTLTVNLGPRDGHLALVAAGRFEEENERRSVGDDDDDTGDDDDSGDDDDDDTGDDTGVVDTGDDDDDDDDDGPERWELRVEPTLTLTGKIGELELAQGLDLPILVLMRPDRWLEGIDPEEVTPAQSVLVLGPENNPQLYDTVVGRIQETQILFPGEEVD